MNTLNKYGLLLHGREGAGNNHWFPRIKSELEKINIKVINPDLPNTAKPILDEQLNSLNNFDLPNKKLTIIGHSLGAILSLKYIEKRNISDSNIILVAPAFSREIDKDTKKKLGEKYNFVETYFNHAIDFNLINSLNNTYTIFLSKDDPFIDFDLAKKNYSKLKNVKFHFFDNKGHFSTKNGIFKLEELLIYL